ncbi:DUF5329 domain-containing protein [Undibacterium sp. LX40W]|uniref:DUF5329 domain-containing protein n=2 Tax=Oxalobacteraceae TaxID=75682 RepID=A0A923HT34_9BURK|nr:DUF5329 domain-containing protein [Undibacterium nitidum]MBC3893002.1 DUF5329 domain-containing protein [Undibacterium sp. LX40W]
MPFTSASAAEMSAASRVEVEVLLNHLSNSGCQFNRNGTWYSAQEAKAHLSKKLDYVVEKKLATTAEQFIDAAASKSSMSGKAYQVKCGNDAAQESALWLQAALREIRNKKAATGK